jgi:peptidoglycan/xylan/chitin deacetylase (PgdA/CDA1 family)
MQKRIAFWLPFIMIILAIVLYLLAQPALREEAPLAEAAEVERPLAPGSMLYLPADAQSEAKLVRSGSSVEGKMRIALTFDSGWIAEYTPALLDILRAEGVLATFFHRGKWAEANPDLIRQMIEDGHLIGNHTYTHPHMDKLTTEAVVTEIEQAHKVLEELIGYSPWLYRPPYGSCTPSIRRTLSQLGYTHSVMWSIDTHDWKDPGVNYIVRRVLDNAHDGAVVLMHVGAGQTVEALPQIIAELRCRGFEFVLIDEIIVPWGTVEGLIPYRVRPGDTLGNLMDTYGLSKEDLITVNPGLISSSLKPHQQPGAAPDGQYSGFYLK